jgi:hypothetical protein
MMADFLSERDQLTEDWMQRLEVGMAFTEMYAYHIVIVHREDDYVVALSILAGREDSVLPDNGELWTGTPHEFRLEHAYGNIPGYWVSATRMMAVDGWYEYALAREVTA